MRDFTGDLAPFTGFIRVRNGTNIVPRITLYPLPADVNIRRTFIAQDFANALLAVFNVKIGKNTYEKHYTC